MADLTGAIAFERFTGPQILKVATTDAEAYAKIEVSRGFKDFPLISSSWREHNTTDTAVVLLSLLMILCRP